MKELKEMILRVGTMFMPLGFMVSLVDYPVYAGITFLIGFISLLELISIKKNKKIKL
jgi:ABC-type antimicrobial peptide transport system permease subunit